MTKISEINKCLLNVLISCSRHLENCTFFSFSVHLLHLLFLIAYECLTKGTFKFPVPQIALLIPRLNPIYTFSDECTNGQTTSVSDAQQEAVS